MKDYKRLAVGAQLGNTSDGILVANIVDFDGGTYDLQPKLFSGVDDGVGQVGGVILVDPSRPGSYGLQIQGSPEALTRLGRALLTAGKGKTDDDDNSDA